MNRMGITRIRINRKDWNWMKDHCIASMLILWLLSPDILREIGDQLFCVGHHFSHHPGQQKEQAQEDRDDLRYKGQGHFMDLSQRLKKADDQSYDQPHAHDGQ